jgi:general secretion pathway protein M
MAIKLTRREKYAIFAASGFICLFVVIRFIVFPLMDKRERLERMLQDKQHRLGEIVALKSEYDALRKEAELTEERLANRKADFSLFSFLDKLAGQTGVKGHIAYMKPSQSDQEGGRFKTSLVEMKLEAVTIDQLISYLYAVEMSENMVRIQRIAISKTGKQEQFINAVLQVETFVI